MSVYLFGEILSVIAAEVFLACHLFNLYMFVAMRVKSSGAVTKKVVW